jgi:Fe-S-cluster containining protein
VLALSLGVASDPVSELCPACGLCCNGALFADVELARVDDPAKMAALGLALHKKGRKLAFAQPCACYDGKWCRAYDSRPDRCRTFECRLLKQVRAGKVTSEKALEVIRRVQSHLRDVRLLLEGLGVPAGQLPLTGAFGEAMAQPIDLGQRGAARNRARLMQTMARLMNALDKLFRS